MTGIAAVLVGLLLNAFTLPPKASANKVADPPLTWYQVEDLIYININYPINPGNPMTKSQFLDYYAGVCSGYGIDCARGFYPEEPPVDESQQGCLTVQTDFN